MNHPATWVVVANSCEAKLFRVSKFPKLEQVHHLEHPASKLRNSELVSSKQGRNFQSGGTTRHTYQPETDPKKMEEEIFAKEVARLLAEARQANAFSRLFIVASPSFLGLIRPHLDGQTQKCVIAEIHKDMLEHKTDEIEKLIASAQP